MGRRWGKTVLGGALVLNVLRQHGHAAWVVPTYKNGRSLWRYVQAVCAPLAKLKVMDISKSERTITTHLGGLLGIYSADNIDAIRSEWFNLVAIDEAARVSEEARNDAIMPTLADAGGCEVDISTPKGMNWFYTEWQRGQGNDPSIKSWNAPTSANPLPNIRLMLQKVMRLVKLGRISSRTLNQEWLAHFLGDGAKVFIGARAVSVLVQEEPDPAKRYVIGVDWGRTNDFTVISVWSIGELKEVYLDAFTDLPWHVQYQKVKTQALRYNNALVIAEANNAQDAHVEALALMGVRVMPFITQNAPKAYGIDQLVGALDTGIVKLQNDDTGILEMEAFESGRTPTGLVKYGAPEGLHDDIPMARLFAYSAIAETRPVILD